jgi:hypothetical protein
MKRITITINDTIWSGMQKIRGALIADEENFIEDMSITTAINMLILAGIIGADVFRKEHWETIADFLRSEGKRLDEISFGDKHWTEEIRKFNPDLR